MLFFTRMKEALRIVLKISSIIYIYIYMEAPPLRGLPFGSVQVCKMCVLSKRNGASIRQAPFRLDETHMSTTCVKRVLAHAFRLGEMLKNTCVGVTPTTIAMTSHNFVNVFGKFPTSGSGQVPRSLIWFGSSLRFDNDENCSSYMIIIMIVVIYNNMIIYDLIIMLYIKVS